MLEILHQRCYRSRLSISVSFAAAAIADRNPLSFGDPLVLSFFYRHDTALSNLFAVSCNHHQKR